MFFPKGKKVMDLMKDYNSVAYVYHDGVVVRGKERVKTERGDVDIETYHVFPADVQFFSSDYNRERGFGPAERLVLRNATLLLHGLTRVEVHYGSGSDNSRQAGQEVVHTILYMPSGMRISFDHLPRMLHSDTIPQPCPGDMWGVKVGNSIAKYKNGSLGHESLWYTPDCKPIRDTWSCACGAEDDEHELWCPRFVTESKE